TRRSRRQVAGHPSSSFALPSSHSSPGSTTPSPQTPGAPVVAVVVPVLPVLVPPVPSVVDVVVLEPEVEPKMLVMIAVDSNSPGSAVPVELSPVDDAPVVGFGKFFHPGASRQPHSPTRTGASRRKNRRMRDMAHAIQGPHGAQARLC